MKAMLQYLVILLDETSTSFCHYENTKQERKLMPLDVLRKGIRFGMTENQMIQFVYPDYELPQEYQEAVESIDHSKIKPYGQEDADVLIVNGFQKVKADVPVVLRITKQELFARQEEVAVM
ncbi:MAG: CXXX repeat peptide maturase, partial [Bacteroidaceae bacterium]|nr:CXXX repeat peptide maturase [Bacteroidaceae bacterium]